MLKLSMLLGCILMTNTTSSTTAHKLEEAGILVEKLMTSVQKREISGGQDFDKYSVTCYICVNVSDNIICNDFAIDRPCKVGENFCHTLHIMDSKGTSVLVNKKCTTDRECQRNKVGCVQVDTQTMCISCCDENYCNVDVPTNVSNAIYDDKITKMRMHAKNLFSEQEKAMTTTIKRNDSCHGTCHSLPLTQVALLITLSLPRYFNRP